jgi:hypothetical protein
MGFYLCFSDFEDGSRLPCASDPLSVVGPGREQILEFFLPL